MKKLLVLLMAVLLMISVVPVSTFAIEKNDPEFEKFLKEINWAKKDYIDYLNSKDWSLDEFSDVEELGTPLSEAGVLAVMTQFELTRDELNALMVEFGEIEEGEDVLESVSFIFNEDLEFYTDYYLSAGIEEDDLEFLNFLEEINWSKEDYLDYLASKEWSLLDFWEVTDLGTPLTEQGVQTVMADFDLTRDELNALLVENFDLAEGEDVMDGMSLIFNEDLYSFVGYYLDDEYYEEIDFGIEGIFTEIGLTDEELDRLFDHFLTLNLEDEVFLAQLEVLAERMEAIEVFESADDLDAAQIAEILSIFTDMMNLFEVEAKYSLTNGQDTQPLTLASLMTLETTNGYDLLIEIYNTQGTFLADILFTAEMFGSEIIAETGKDLEVVKEVIAAPKKETTAVKQEKKAVKTVKGGKLPKTASGYLNNALLGLVFVLIGLVLFRRMKTIGD